MSLNSPHPETGDPILQDANDRKETLERSLEDANNKLSKLEAQKAAVEEKIAAAASQAAQIQAQISSVEDEIEKLLAPQTQERWYADRLLLFVENLRSGDAGLCGSCPFYETGRDRERRFVVGLPHGWPREGTRP